MNSKAIAGMFPAIILATAIPLSSCETTTHAQQGEIIGGVIGGVVGSQIGDGRGQTAATIIGTIAGSMIGRHIGETMDEHRDIVRSGINVVPGGDTPNSTVRGGRTNRNRRTSH